jgi:hypothetical protein
VGFFLYLCTVIQFVRKYAYVIVLVLMSAFAACLVADEWSDMRHAWQDLQIEATAEIEVEDFEWDESDISCQPGRTCISRQTMMCIPLPFREGLGLVSSPFTSNKQRLGLVRRYAPRKALLSDNCTLT